MKTSDFDYVLPEHYIAQTPVEPRDSSRLMVLNRKTGIIQHAIFRDIGDFLDPGDLLVLNETRVISARIYARKYPSGGKVEILLLKCHPDLVWEVLVGGKGLTLGKRIILSNGIKGEIIEVLDGSRRMIRFDQSIDLTINQIGNVPLPPYIHSQLSDPERYQTVFAQVPGSSAAPTAGLHFTHNLFQSLKQSGIQTSKIILHIGLDTFAPVNEEDPFQHMIHSEWCNISSSDAQKTNEAKANGHRIIAIGTTSVRTLESTALANRIQPFSGSTDLFILPGFQFKIVDAMVTNFHLPRSTLIMLVSAFVGREKILYAYQTAMEKGYRFYSFGDAMLII